MAEKTFSMIDSCQGIIKLNNQVVLSNGLDAMQEDIEEDIGYDPRDGKTEYQVIVEEDSFGNVGIDFEDALLFVSVEICEIINKEK